MNYKHVCKESQMKPWGTNYESFVRVVSNNEHLHLYFVIVPGTMFLERNQGSHFNIQKNFESASNCTIQSDTTTVNLSGISKCSIT